MESSMRDDERHLDTLMNMTANDFIYLYALRVDRESFRNLVAGRIDDIHLYADRVRGAGGKRAIKRIKKGVMNIMWAILSSQPNFSMRPGGSTGEFCKQFEASVDQMLGL